MQKDCCSNNPDKIKKGFFGGLIYGLIPHSFCILFVIFSVVGATLGTMFFKKILLIPYLFPILVCLSLIFATLSAVIYLRRNHSFSFSGIKRKWRYLGILFGTTILVNLLFFYVIFPTVANFGSAAHYSGARNSESLSLVLKVEIPCSGHAPLIIDELDKAEGIKNVVFKSPNYFEINYDPEKISQQEILSLEIFKTFKASVKND